MDGRAQTRPLPLRILRRVLLLLLGLLVLMTAVLLLLLRYDADETAQASMRSGAGVTVSETDYGWQFDGPGEDTALIFYPGAGVEEAAYAPLLHALAEEGVDTCLVRMPLRFAILDVKAAQRVMAEHDYAHWYLGGHSLGAAMAASFAAGHPDGLDGVILLAGYATAQLPGPMTEIAVVGSEDRVLMWSMLERGRVYAPEHYVEHIITGGNHAQFGSYGRQLLDGEASISPEEQVRETVSVIVETVALP